MVKNITIPVIISLFLLIAFGKSLQIVSTHPFIVISNGKFIKRSFVNCTDKNLHVEFRNLFDTLEVYKIPWCRSILKKSIASDNVIISQVFEFVSQLKERRHNGRNKLYKIYTESYVWRIWWNIRKIKCINISDIHFLVNC